MTTLDRERKLVRPFLKWLKARSLPAKSGILLAEQGVPGTTIVDTNELESKGLPDGSFYTDDDWLLMLECKVQDSIKVGQLKRHVATAKRHGFETPQLVVIAVDENPELPKGVTHVSWRQVYSWFNTHVNKSQWAKEFVRYMEVFERKMLDEGYNIRGTITMFDGLRFDEETPYTYREGKRLIRLLGDELRKRPDLHKMGVDPKGERRSAITGKRSDGVWDFLPLKAANGKHFTKYPHLTIGLQSNSAVAAVTFPNGMKGFRKRFREMGPETFLEQITKQEKRLRPIIDKSKNAKPLIIIQQRHYRSRNSLPTHDACLEADLRTIVSGGRSGIKYQSQWVETVFELISQKKSNMQMSVQVTFSYECPLIRSSKAIDLFADSWKALLPVVDTVLAD